MPWLPVPIMPIVIFLLGASFPNTLEGIIVGKETEVAAAMDCLMALRRFMVLWASLEWSLSWLVVFVGFTVSGIFNVVFCLYALAGSGEQTCT